MLIIPDPLMFQWDGGNREKNHLKYKVTNLESDEIFANEPIIIIEDPPHSVSEKRHMAWGRTNSNRKLTVIFTIRNQMVRVISARDMNKKERKFYEK